VIRADPAATKFCGKPVAQDQTGMTKRTREADDRPPLVTARLGELPEPFEASPSEVEVHSPPKQQLGEPWPD